MSECEMVTRNESRTATTVVNAAWPGVFQSTRYNLREMPFPSVSYLQLTTSVRLSTRCSTTIVLNSLMPHIFLIVVSACYAIFSIVWREEEQDKGCSHLLPCIGHYRQYCYLRGCHEGQCRWGPCAPVPLRPSCTCGVFLWPQTCVLQVLPVPRPSSSSPLYIKVRSKVLSAVDDVLPPGFCATTRSACAFCSAYLSKKDPGRANALTGCA